MNIVSATESWSGIQWSGDSSQRTTTRAFLVETDTPSRGVFNFPITSGSVTIPEQGTEHPDLPEFISGVPTITPVGPTLFEIRIGYLAVGANGDGSQNENLNPLDQPADISWEDEDRMVAYDRDAEDKVVANTMNQLYEPRLTRVISDPVLVIERNEAGFDPNDKLDYQDTVCSETFWGAAAGRARLGKIRGRKVNAKVPYWRKGYRIAFRMNTPKGVAAADAWKLCVSNQGTKYKDAAGKEQDTSNGEIALLDADSKKTTRDKPHWLYFTEFKSKSWSRLGIGSNQV